jgi:phospholipid-binding lipoprotein MlaA
MRILLLMLLGMLGGCASQVLTIHTLPDETPAADNAAAAASAAAFAEAAATATGQMTVPGEATSGAAAATGAGGATGPGAATSGQATPAESSSPGASKDVDLDRAVAERPVTPADAPPMYTYDPWERLNRFTYRFNARFDEAVFLPVTNTYKRIPGFLRAGVHNFFSNLSEIDSGINYTLQWRLKYGLRSVERLVINSTLGIGGLIDVATKLKLPGAPTGFATTLAKWGMHPGPYWVMPLLGPSTLRDGVGFAADYGTMYGIDIFHLYRGNVSWGLGTANGIDERANIDFRYYSTASPFEYENIRFLYVRRRLIEDEGLHAKDPRKRPPPDAPAGK